MKRIIKNIIHFFYKIGFAEQQRSDLENRDFDLLRKARISESSVIAPSARIQNDTGNKDAITIGDNCIIKGYILIYNHGGNISIGSDCFIGEDTYIWSAKNIIIGNRVLISHNVNIHDNNAHPTNSRKRHEDYLHIFRNGLNFENDLNEKSILIEDDVWIGFNSTIFKGVRIGRGAIIGACTIVTEDVPEFAVVIGNPQKIIKYTS